MFGIIQSTYDQVLRFGGLFQICFIRPLTIINCYRLCSLRGKSISVHVFVHYITCTVCHFLLTRSNFSNEKLEIISRSCVLQISVVILQVSPKHVSRTKF